MDMLKGDQIAEANLTDWRKLAQGLHAGRCWCCRQLTRRFTRTRLVVGSGAGPAGRASGNRPRSPGVSGFGKDQSTVGRVWTKARRDGTGVADPAEPLRAASQRIDAVHASVGQAGFPHDRG
jgi:hypothetical protein